MSVFSGYMFLIAVLIVWAMGIFILALLFNKERSKSIQLNDKLKLSPRVSPFIAVHLSLLSTPEQEENSEAQDKLKQKIEGFKSRNRFYES